MAERDVESFSDFIQYYSNHYVRSAKDPHVMYLVHGPADMARHAATVTKYTDGRRAEGMVLTQAQVWDEMQWGLPPIGMTVYNDAELMYLYYRTARNGGRGYARDRIVNRSFNSYILTQHGVPVVTNEDLSDPVHAWLAMTPRHVSLAEAWEGMQGELPKRLAYSLSYKFGVYLSHKEHPVLCYKMYELGDVLGPNKLRLRELGLDYVDVIRRTLNPQMEIEVQ